MKFKIVIKSLALFFISVSALGTPADGYFLPGGLWAGKYNAMCNGKLLTGNGTMEVQPLSTWSDSNGTKYEDFAGILTMKDLPPDCVDIDFTNGVALTRGTYASVLQYSPATFLNLVIATNTGNVINQSYIASMSNIDISFRNSQNSSNFVDLDVWNPNNPN